MKKSIAPAPHLAPSIRAIPFLNAAAERDRTRLTDRQRQELSRIGVRLRLPARMVIYREDAAAEWVFAVAEGAVKCYRELPSGKRIVSAFLFARDVFGLAEKVKFENRHLARIVDAARLAKLVGAV